MIIWVIWMLPFRLRSHKEICISSKTIMKSFGSGSWLLQLTQWKQAPGRPGVVSPMVWLVSHSLTAAPKCCPVSLAGHTINFWAIDKAHCTATAAHFPNGPTNQLTSPKPCQPICRPFMAHQRMVCKSHCLSFTRFTWETECNSFDIEGYNPVWTHVGAHSTERMAVERWLRGVSWWIPSEFLLKL